MGKPKAHISVTTSGDAVHYVKSGVSKKEHDIHKLVYESGRVKTPRIVSYDEQEGVMTMECVDGMNLCDMYDVPFDDLDDDIKDCLRGIISKVHKLGVEYVDVTGYNFIEDKQREVWIIDFGDAKYADAAKDTEKKYVHAFINGEEGWNEDFL